MYQFVHYLYMFFRCIDGFSRKIVWLRASFSNHQPGLIASYYLDAVLSAGGYPAHVRTDCGTENVTIAAIQALVTGTTSGHLYGTSPGNQRIEAWWSFFRRYRSQWWIELFEHLTEYGAFHPGCVIETECLRFCFMDVIQKDLDEVRRQWNTHRIRPSAGSRCPPGIPDELFYLPQMPWINCMLRNVEPLPNDINSQLVEPRRCEDVDYESYFHYLCNFFNYSLPHDSENALHLYFKLLHCLQ